MTDRVAALNAEVERLCEERDFLLARLGGDPRWVGLSSGAMVETAIRGGEPRFWPADPSDLRRCERTYAHAPAHLRPVMLPVLQRFRAHVAERHPATANPVEPSATTVWTRP